MFPDSLKQVVENTLSGLFNKQCSINNIESVGGGCINESFRIRTTPGDFFIKWNDATRYPGMFKAEGKGLSLLKRTNTIPIPEIIAQNDFNEFSFIILEWIEGGRRQKNFWSQFGENLATLHRESNNYFGLDHDNYIGSLPQSNKPHPTWKEFFIEERLQPQLKLAIDAKRLDKTISDLFEKLFLKFDDLIPKEKSSLLHGDLWNGNYLINQFGSATLIDPAVYYGHREMDLAMTKLFGGFDDEFYAAYQSTFTLQPGFHHRVDIHNLYPLLVHTNLFGGSYGSQVKRILSKFQTSNF